MNGSISAVCLLDSDLKWNLVFFCPLGHGPDYIFRLRIAGALKHHENFIQCFPENKAIDTSQTFEEEIKTIA